MIYSCDIARDNNIVNKSKYILFHSTTPFLFYIVEKNVLQKYDGLHDTILTRYIYQNVERRMKKLSKGCNIKRKIIRHYSPILYALNLFTPSE